MLVILKVNCKWLFLIRVQPRPKKSLLDLDPVDYRRLLSSIMAVLETCSPAWKRLETQFKFQEHGWPCTHAIMAVRTWRLDPYTLSSDAFTLSTYRCIYQASIYAIILQDLEPRPSCLTLLISRKRSRPKTTCIRTQGASGTYCTSWCLLGGPLWFLLDSSSESSNLYKPKFSCIHLRLTLVVSASVNSQYNWVSPSYLTATCELWSLFSR